MRNPLMPIFIVLFILLLIVRISITVGRKRRNRLRALHAFVAARYQASPDFVGERAEFDEALQQVRRSFRDNAPVIAETANRDLSEAVRAMCRSVKLDPAAVSLNLTD
jgi:hypothetical protein